MLLYHQVFYQGTGLPVSGFEVIQTGSATWLAAALDGGAVQLTGQITTAGSTVTLSGAQLTGGSATVLPGPVSGGNYLFAVSPFGSALQIAELDSAGRPGDFAALTGSGGLGITAVEMLADGTDPLVLSTSQGGAALGVFRIDSSAKTLGTMGPALRPASLEDHAITDIALATVGTVQVAVVVSAAASTVATLQVNPDGTLVELDQAGVNSGVGIGQPTQVSVVESGSSSFALVSATGTSSLTVFEIGSDGSLTVTDQINDSAATRFASLAEAAVLEHDGRVFVALAGTDGGVTLIQMLENGTLQALGTYANTGFDLFGEIDSLEMFATGTTLQILTSSADSGALHRFSFDTAQLGDVIRSDGTGIAQGGAQNDILIAEDSVTQLIGGAGADIFVFGPGADTVFIQDYDHGVDTIDLSYWPRVFDIDALEVNTLSDGIQFQHAGRVLNIRTDTGQPLGVEAFTDSDLFALWRLPVAEQTNDDPTADWSGTLGLRLGSQLADVLFGNGQDEVLIGLDGADELHGFVGSDILDGGAGADLLTGGAGRDVFLFEAQPGNTGDVVSDYESAGFDPDTGTLTGDIVFFAQAGALTPTTSGADLWLGGVRLDGAALGNVLVTTSTGPVDSALWGDGLAATLGTGQIANLQATLIDIDGDESFASIDLLFDPSGQVERAFAENDNGTETHYRFDTQAQAPWTRLVDTFDGQGRLTARETSLDTGFVDLLLLDPADIRTWSQINESFDLQGRQTEYMITYDAGNSRRTLTDTADQSSWSTIVELRTSSGVINDKRTTYDDGSQLRFLTDVQSDQIWDTIQELRDTAGQLFDKRTNYDDGSQQRQIFDVDATAIWDSIVELRDAGGRLFDKRTNYDDGNQQRQAFDVDDTASWDQIIELRDTAGALVSKRTVFDTGSVSLLQFDVGDSASWDLIASTFDADGALRSRRTENDDGTTLLRLFDVDNTESWDIYSRLFDSDGMLLSESFL